MLLAASEGAIEGVVIGLLVVALIALAVWAICRFAGRPDWGAIGAAAVAIVGGLLVLLEFV